MASELAERVIDRYSNGEIDSVYLLYNEFKSMIAQRLIVEQVLPIETKLEKRAVRQAEEMGLKEKKQALGAAREAGVGIRPADTREIDAAASKFATAPVDYIYEQPPEELFRSLLPNMSESRFFGRCKSPWQAEHAARMTAMDAATNNATDMIDSLTLAMNRARQAKSQRNYRDSQRRSGAVEQQSSIQHSAFSHERILLVSAEENLRTEC